MFFPLYQEDHAPCSFCCEAPSYQYVFTAAWKQMCLHLWHLHIKVTLASCFIPKEMSLPFIPLQSSPHWSCLMSTHLLYLHFLVSSVLSLVPFPVLNLIIGHMHPLTYIFNYKVMRCWWMVGLGSKSVTAGSYYKTGQRTARFQEIITYQSHHPSHILRLKPL